MFWSITAVAPPVKIGLLVANPWREVAMVMRTKEGSILGGKVHPSDLLPSTCRSWWGEEGRAVEDAGVATGAVGAFDPDPSLDPVRRSHCIQLTYYCISF